MALRLTVSHAALLEGTLDAGPSVTLTDALPAPGPTVVKGDGNVAASIRGAMINRETSAATGAIPQTRICKISASIAKSLRIID